jgi:hypothetical protein
MKRMMMYNKQADLEKLYYALSDEERRLCLEYTLFTAAGLGVITELLTKTKTNEETMKEFRSYSKAFLTNMMEYNKDMALRSPLMKLIIVTGMFGDANLEELQIKVKDAMNRLKVATNAPDTPDAKRN